MDYFENLYKRSTVKGKTQYHEKNGKRHTEIFLETIFRTKINSLSEGFIINSLFMRVSNMMMRIMRR